MISLRRAEERGGADYGWLRTRHTFSFAEYFDPSWMGFRKLRVLNEDVVQPGHGFPRHSHRDAEIVSYVLEGALEHRDSMGNGSVVRPGEVQRMSAGTGVSHSEKNPSASEPVHFLQIWLLPDRAGYPPSYEQKAFSEDERRDRLRLVASRDGRDGSVTVHQDVDMYLSLLSPNGNVTHELAPSRHAWIHVAKGRAQLGSHTLSAGDGAKISDEPRVVLKALDPSELVLFDLS
jgi:hypothetical protein